MFKKYREKNNLSQEEFAELIDVYTRHLQKIEAGDRNMTLTNLLIFWKELNIKDEDIMSWLKEEQIRIYKILEEERKKEQRN